MIICKGQTYAHRNNRRYYEIERVHNGIVTFQYYNSQTNETKFDNRPLTMIEKLVKEGTLIRDC